MSHFHIPFRIVDRKRDIGQPITLKNWYAILGAS